MTGNEADSVLRAGGGGSYDGIMRVYSCAVSCDPRTAGTEGGNQGQVKFFSRA